MPTRQPRTAPFHRCPPATCPATAPPSILQAAAGASLCRTRSSREDDHCRCDQSHLPHPRTSCGVRKRGARVRGSETKSPVMTRLKLTAERTVRFTERPPLLLVQPSNRPHNRRTKGWWMRKARRGWTMYEEDARSMLTMIEERIRSSDIQIEHRDALIRLRAMIDDDLAAREQGRGSSREQAEPYGTCAK